MKWEEEIRELLKDPQNQLQSADTRELPVTSEVVITKEAVEQLGDVFSETFQSICNWEIALGKMLLSKSGAVYFPQDVALSTGREIAGQDYRLDKNTAQFMAGYGTVSEDGVMTIDTFQRIVISPGQRLSQALHEDNTHKTQLESGKQLLALGNLYPSIVGAQTAIYYNRTQMYMFLAPSSEARESISDFADASVRHGYQVPGEYALVFLGLQDASKLPVRENLASLPVRGGNPTFSLVGRA